jgi:Carboxypeptidase regulatory-like domain
MKMNTRKWAVFVRSILLAAVVASRLPGQGDRGVLTGTVRDASAAVVPGALVMAIHTSTNVTYKSTSSTAGEFTVPSLPVGAYKVRVERPGFKTHVRENVLLTAGGTVRVDIALELGTTQQTVEVTATAQLVQADTASVATAVSNTLVDGLPVVVNGASRSPFDLAATAPEVSTSGGSFRIAGGNNTWGMTLDGTSITGNKQGSDQATAAMNSPSVEALTEFTVEAAGFKAETGHASGGTASFVSKSGTNTFHGSAFEFMRNQALDARGFFGAAKAVYKQNNFGVTAGGPVRIPKLYNGKDKTFFFVSYEGFRNRVGATPTPSSVPPPEFTPATCAIGWTRTTKRIRSTIRARSVWSTAPTSGTRSQTTSFRRTASIRLRSPFCNTYRGS